jgi:hypothetical protein
MLMKRIRARRRGQEQGNIIVAMLIILVVATIGTAMTYRVINNESIVLSRQGTASALATANAGLADALFRLDQGSSAEGNGVQFFVSPTACSGNCVATTVPGIDTNPKDRASVQYVATQVNAGEWYVDSVGTVRNQRAAVHEVVTRAPKYPFALFANSSLSFNGNAQGSFSTYTDGASYSSTPGNPNPNPNGSVSIGSNGAITCNGGIGNNVQTDYYGTASVGSLSSSCSNSQSFQNIYYLPSVSTNLPDNCPNGGNLGSGFGSTWNTLNAGTYVCDEPVNISGLLQVTGAVTLYINLTGGSYNSSTAALTIATPSYVNDLYDYCQNTTPAPAQCTPAPNLPAAANFQVLINSAGQVGFANGQGYYFGGILYAPQAYLTEDGCKSHYYGSLTINTLTCNGGPHLYVSYDTALQGIYGSWAPSSYTQENPSSVTIP